MDSLKAYLFCPRCGHKVKQTEDFVLLCSHCHFNNYISPVPCNAGIIENNNGEILLVRRAVDPHKDEWDLPGGFIMPEEDFKTSLQREVLEELGCRIEVRGIIGAYTDNYLYQDVLVPTLGIVASCNLLSHELHPADDISEYKFFPKSEVLRQKIAFQSIRQALSDYFS